MQLKNTFRNSEFWAQLLAKKQLIVKKSISQLFLTDPNRFQNFSVNIDNLDLLVDFSKQYIDSEIMKMLCDAAKHCELEHKIKDLFKGSKINFTEERKVWHTALREPNPAKDVAMVLQKMTDFTENLYRSNCQNILCLGIGGSYLGPMMVCQALDQYTHKLAKNLKLHFIANVDPETIDNILGKLNPSTTIAIISSKSFTTEETIRNMKTITSWLTDQTKIFAVTCNVNKAIEFGINIENIFPFWDFVGGRYSVWSAVGLPIAIKLGMENFKKFLFGAYTLDQHFINIDFSKNLPILMAFIGIWNINFMQYKSLAIMPYLDSLEYFPHYLQQVEMESNGKTVDLQNNYIDHDTAPVIWGGVGCNGQHSYMQMLHQGSQIVPVDFLVATKKSGVLFANCLAQSQALMQGNSDNTKLEKFKHCNGNRPNSIILFPQLTPEILGALIALYEHKVFVQGVMWNINSFDQWGVELGKNLANKIMLQLDHKLSFNDYPNLVKL
jgi:glucose-6-phosphate isomerase